MTGLLNAFRQTASDKITLSAQCTCDNKRIFLRGCLLDANVPQCV